jgi:ABC-type glycerol-3-phosphate transport system substrate-binding protein
MEYAVSWLNEEYKGDIEKVNRSGSWTYFVEDGKPPAFQEGRLAMVESGFWATGDLYQVEPKFERWDVAQYPVGPNGNKTVSGYWPNWLVIPKGSHNKEEAFKYLDYMTVEGIKVWFNNIPDLPANKEVPRLVPAITVKKRGRAFAEEITDFFRAQLDIATPMWNSPVQDFGNDQLQRALERIMTKKASPKEALAEAQKTSQNELDKVLRSVS